MDKAKKPTKRHALKFCPRCGSDDVYWAQGMPQLWSIWQCHRCGYQGPVILQDGNMAGKIDEEWKKQKGQEKP